MTIEAVIIMPIIFVLIWFLVYLGFFLYNESISVFGTYLAASRAANITTGRSEYTVSEAERNVKELLGGRYVSMNCPEIRAESDKSKVCVEYSGELKVPFISEGTIFENIGVMRIEGFSESEYHRPVTYIREIRKIDKLFSKDGGEE